MARLAVELDGFQHGQPRRVERDLERDAVLSDNGIEVLRYWNRQWHENQEGVLLEIFHALHQRTGCIEVERKLQNRRFIPPRPSEIKEKKD
jgi:very-short-patch-repair endonuclease